MKQLVRIFRISNLEFKINGKSVYCRNTKYTNDAYHPATSNELQAIKFIAKNNSITGRKALSILNTISL
jgi:hypothetical protein